MTFLTPVALPYHREEWGACVRGHAAVFFNLYCQTDRNFDAVCFMLVPRGPLPVVACVDEYDDADELILKIADAIGPPHLPARTENDDGMVLLVWPIQGSDPEERAHVMALLREVADAVDCVAAATISEAWLRHPSAPSGTGSDVLMVLHETKERRPVASVAGVRAVGGVRVLDEWRDLPRQMSGGMAGILPRDPQGSLDFTPIKINTRDVGLA
jgi:hypothetical protein